MNDFTHLVRPEQSQVRVDPTPKECLVDGFSYPSFRLMNKHSRVSLSQPLNIQATVNHRLFAVANTQGWFAAVKYVASTYHLILSPLQELRSAFKSAKEGHDELYTPKRTLFLSRDVPNIVIFVNNGTRLVVGTEQGSITIFDATRLFSSGSEDIPPLHVSSGEFGPIQQIEPNPGTEPGLSNLMAVVHGNGTVTLNDTQLQVQAGWASNDPKSAPVSVAWSPKGKHLAIGMRSGDILTFSMNNKSAPLQHIPATADAQLVSFQWLGPGHTFCTSYVQNSSDLSLHVVSLDTKASTANYLALTNPFPIPDRSRQYTYVLKLPKWDVDAGSSDDSQTLYVMGDKSSVDLEVLGSSGSQWYQQSQENPLTLPLDSSMEDTILVALEVDLTDREAAAPIMYSYLNDGTLQGWHIEHTKSYAAMVSPSTHNGSTEMNEDTSTQTTSPFNRNDSPQVVMTVTNPSSPFGQQNTSSNVFGSTSEIGQRHESAFGNETGSSFGQPLQQSGAGQFSSFSSPEPGQQQSSGSVFGQPSLKPAFQPTHIPTNSPFAAGASNSFARFGASPSPNVSNVFGQSNFGFGAQPVASTSPDTVAHAPTITREASMSDSTPSFGGLSLGARTDSNSTKPSNSIFGSFGAPAVSPMVPEQSAFGGAIKPLTGFGAFSNYQPPAIKPVEKSDTSTPSLGGPSQTGASSFGMSGFAKPAFGQSSFGTSGFGQPSFGQSSFGKPATTGVSTTPTVGGFGAFAQTSSTPFQSAAQQVSKSDSNSVTSGFDKFASHAGGFGAFASSAPVSFGGSKSDNPQNNSSFSAIQSTNQATSPFTPRNDKPILDNSSGADSRKAAPFPVKSSANPIAAISPSSSPEPILTGRSMSPANDSPPPSNSAKAFPSPSSGAFSNLQSTQSAFKPASGFGAFGVTVPNSSPFFQKQDNQVPAVTAFSPASTPSFKVSQTLATAPTFGSPSLLGSSKTSFTSPTQTPQTPSTTTINGGFGAFSGSGSGFSAFSGQKKSFSDLLKTETDSKIPAKPSQETNDQTDEKKEVKETTATLEPKHSPPTSVINPPPAPSPPDTKTPTEADEDKEPKVQEQQSKSDNPVLSSVSFSSVASSFVEVEAENTGSDASGNEDSEEQDGGDEDDSNENGSFLSGSLGSRSNDGSDEESDDHESDGESDDAPDLQEASIPLPESRSPSFTPQPLDVPKVHVIPSPPSLGALELSPTSDQSTIREASTTPPGTPIKEPLQTNIKGTTASPPFGLGLGRPSTRPTRSSPLASTPLSGEGEGEGDDDDVPEDASATVSMVPKPETTKTSSLADSIEKSSTNKRPKTPPLLSSFTDPQIPQVPSTPVLKPAIPPAARPGLTPPVASAFPPLKASNETFTFNQPPSSGFFDKVATNTSAASTPILTRTMSKPELVRGVTAPASPNVFSTQSSVSKQPANVFSAPKSDFKFPNQSTFGKQDSQQSSTTSERGVFSLPPSKPASSQPGQMGPLGTPPAASGSSGYLVPPKPLSPEITMEEGMQKECARLIMSLDRELQELRELSQKVSKKRLMLVALSGGSRKKSDLSDVSKWRLADAEQFGQVLQQYGSDLTLLEEQRDKQKSMLRELQNNMLKATTRKEEIARFIKAKSDADFAKMLRTRTLGPEHLETQTHLRRNIRVTRDRIQKLEGQLQTSKKRLAEVASGKPTLRPPSIDTINRTYRNIDLAIHQQADDVAKLATRIAKLDITSPNAKLRVSRDARLPDEVSRRQYNVTPHIALTTAAALNAERSAHKLKKALLAIRKEPLLNNKAASAPPAPVTFTTPTKGVVDTPQKSLNTLPFAFQTPTPGSGPLFPQTISSPTTLPEWTLPNSNFNPSPPLPTRRGAGATTKKHSTVPLKKSTGIVPPPAPTTFDWGPLPTFNTPATSMVDTRAAQPRVALPAGFVPLTSSRP